MATKAKRPKTAAGELDIEGVPVNLYRPHFLIRCLGEFNSGIKAERVRERIEEIRLEQHEGEVGEDGG